MTDAIIAIVVALIGMCGSIIAVSITSKTTQNKVMTELQTQNALQNKEIKQLGVDMVTIHDELMNKIEHNQQINELKFNSIEREMGDLKDKVDEHNHYSKLFNENVPVIHEKLKITEHRLAVIEQELKENRKAN